MSRRQNAIVAAAFVYAQSFLAIAASLYTTRLLITVLGQDTYGMWLATGALFGYAGLADLGILGIMPWLFAEADGRKDVVKLRELVYHGLLTSVAGAILTALVLAVLWALVPRIVHLSAADVSMLRGPVLAMFAITVIGYPLRLFSALRNGLQDYRFAGTWSLLQTGLSFAITIILSLTGHALYGIALGGTIPGFVGGLAALIRTVTRNPELFGAWSGPSLPVLRNIITSGAGQWLASVGVQLAFASDNVVIAAIGSRELVPSFTVTSRLGLTLMQMAWTLPDSASVGLAQLNAEGNRPRVGEVVRALLRLNLLGAGLIACGVLAGNGGFVTAWVGPALFGGTALNAAFALDVIALSVVHGLVVPAAVLGERVRVGVFTLLNGLVHIGLAIVLGRVWGLVGIAAATGLSALLTTMPAGVALLSKVATLDRRAVLREAVGPWLVRCIPIAILATAVGPVLMRTGLVASAGRLGALGAGIGGGALAGVAYLLVMRPLMRELPLGPRIHRILAVLRLA